MEMAQKAAEHQMKLNEISKQAEEKDEGRDNAE
jgi:hypothetical protein